MNHYRVIARSIWNTGFWADPEFRNWDSRDHFEQIMKLTFNALVVARTQETGCCADLSTMTHPIYQVVPLDPGPVPIMIHRPRENDRNMYWDDPVREVKPTNAEFHFLDYFDWNKMDYLDLQYYRVRIVAFDSQPHLIGREALLEHQHASVFLKDLPTAE
jgi:hypothetical protein